MQAILGMLKENGEYSLTRVLVVIGYIVFIIVSIVLAVKGIDWSNYGEFAAVTGTTGLVQLGNKFINSKYNTALGEYGKKPNQ